MFLGRQAISTNPDALTLGQQYEIAAGSLDLDMAVGTSGLTEAMLIRALNGMIGARVWVGVHTGDPGANGTANLVTDIGRIELVLADFTVT